MWRIPFSTFLIPVLPAVALMLAPAMVPAADIVDGGGFFSAETLAKANQTIREIEEKSKHEIRIETFASAAADKVDAVKKMDKTEREAFFTKWLHERADKTQARGVFILINKEPAHLRLWGAKEIQQAGFGAEQAKSVRELLLAGFKSKEYDKTLSDALVQLEKTFGSLKAVPKKSAEAGHAAAGQNRATHPSPSDRKAQSAPKVPVNRAPQPAAANPEAKSWNIVVVIAIVLGGIFLFSAVMRMFGGGQSHGAGGYGGGYGGGGGGGGFMSGLAGGIFGAVAGNWLYNQFSGHSASASETHAGDHGSSNFTDASSSAYNDDILDTGSSDMGGTDFGGGDFGGGDFDAGDGGGDF